MKELGTTPEELSETRIPSTPQTDTFPVQCELLASHETLPPPSLEQSSILETPDSRTPGIQSNPSKDVGTILAPEALAALRAHFQVQGVPPVGSQSRGKHPVLKTNTGSFLVAPNPPPPLSPVPQIPRSLVNRPPRPPEPVLFTTPERRISVQSPTPALLVQAGVGQYQILGRTNNEGPGLNQGRILDSRMLPIEMKTNQNHPIPQPSTTVLQNPASCSSTTPLTPKLQTGKILHHQELTHSLMERSALPVPLNLPSTSSTLAAAVENLKSQFLNGDIKQTQDFQKSDSAPFQELQKSDPGHKRRKTSFKDSLSLPFYSTPLNGLELLLQAAKLSGDDLPEDLEDDRSPRIFCPPFGSTLGSFIGVYPLLDGSFIARCRYKGCYVPIGSFNSAELAARAYDRVVLGLRGRKAKTNYSPSEYLGFELENARRALDTKYKQCHQTRRGSAWPWARAAQTLLINDEDGTTTTTLLSNSCHDYVLNNVPELVQNVAPLTEALPGNSVFELLQTVMSKKRDLNGTFDLIQSKIRQLQQRIQSGLSTEEECNCVGQYACVASILSSLVSMQKEWERRNSNFESDSLLAKGEELLDPPSSFSEPSRKPNSRIIEESDSAFPKQSISEGNSRDFTQPRLSHFSSKRNIPSSSFQEAAAATDCDHSNAECLREGEVPSVNEDQVDETSGGGGNGPLSKTDVDSCPYTESIRWVRLLASSLWPRKRGGGMLWKAYQPLFKSSHHRHSILKLREELFLRPDDHVGGSQSEGSND